MAGAQSVPSLTATVPDTAEPLRHTAVVRLTHWVTTLCFFALLVSGIEILISHPRFYWGETGSVLTPSLFDLPIPASRSSVSKAPFANGRPPRDEADERFRAEAFTDWRLAVDGLVARPASFSLAELQSYPPSSHITHLACEEGWSFIAEWIGAPLSHLLNVVGIRPEAKYVVYFSMQRGWWDSVDMADALHPQTLVTYGMNGSGLPVGHGAPIRLRVPRQLGYKSVKYLTRLTVTDSLKGFGEGLGSAAREDGYSWYAGI